MCFTLKDDGPHVTSGGQDIHRQGIPHQVGNSAMQAPNVEYYRPPEPFVSDIPCCHLSLRF